MAKKKRTERIPTMRWDEPQGTGVTERLASRSVTFYLTLGVIALAVVAIGVIAYGVIADYIGDQRRPGSTAVRVGETEYDLRYYTERLTSYVQQNGGAGSQLAQPSIAMPAVTSILVEETILVEQGSELGITVSDDEVNEQLATRLNTTADSPDFEARLEDELARTGISEEQLRFQTEAEIARDKATAYFVGELPEMAESINYRQILVETQEEADEIKAEIEGGADGAELARERSLDTGTSEEGGEVGWTPRGVLPQTLEDTLFALEPGEVTINPLGQNFFVYELIDADANRAIEDDRKPELAEADLEAWLDEQRASYEVEDLVSTDTDKQEWAITRAYNL